MADEPEVGGLSLARNYWRQVVRPILDDALPAVPRAAARIGTGSDVLGLDDRVSRDHDWGLRLQVVVTPRDVDRVLRVLEDRLPAEHDGHPTRFCFTGQPDPQLGIDVVAIDELLTCGLGFDPRHDPTTLDWLSVTGQAVLELTAGEVFEDTAGELTAVRGALAWYPDDIWRYLVASDWQRLDQELPLMGRAGDRGDDLGSRVITSRLVDVAVHLAFLLCRRWPPYSKWRGTVFGSLPLAPDIGHALHAALTVADQRSRGEHLSAALDGLAQAQRRAGIPAPQTVCVPFWDRPYLHIDPDLIPGIMAEVDATDVRELPVGLGSIEQRTDNVDLLVNTTRRREAVGAGELTRADPHPVPRP